MERIKFSVVLIAVCVVKCLAMTYDELEDFAEHLKKTSQLSPTLKKGVDPDIDYDEEEAVSDHAWEESGKFEGDLILNERQRRLIVEEVAEGLSRNGITDGTKRWPNNEVIYYIQVEHFTSDQIQAIASGIEDLARASCVKFRPYKKGDRDAVVIQGSRRGCFSQVGYQGGYQVLNLSGRHPAGRGCFRHGTVVHELLHTLGFYHMQSSPDRDDYVNIVWSNIVKPARHNFRKYNSFSVSDFGVGYDYDSVLHYSRRAFSANGQDTIVPKQSGAEIGQRIGLSDKDTQKLNKMYCDADSDTLLTDDDTDTSKKNENKKKNGKNKPYEGHGIGYHQGKAVAFKLLPAAETYKLPDVPSFHVFDYFSKEPQILSPSEKEGFRIGKEIAYTYNPSRPLSTQKNEKPDNFDTNSESKPDLNEVKLQVHNNNYDNIGMIQQVYNNDNKQLSDSNRAVDLPKHDRYVPAAEEKKVDPDLINAFDRLSKILKMHVYPSQTPDLSVYKMNDHYNNHYSHPQDKENTETIVFSTPVKTVNLGKDYTNSDNRDNQWQRQTYQQSHENIEESPMAETPKIENYRSFIPFPLNKHYDDQQLFITGFESPAVYRDKEEHTSIYSPKNPKGPRINENHDEWHNKYIPYYSELDYYHSKHREPEYHK